MPLSMTRRHKALSFSMAVAKSLDKNCFTVRGSHGQHGLRSVPYINGKIRPICATCTDGSSFAHRVEVSVYKQVSSLTLHKRCGIRQIALYIRKSRAIIRRRSPER